MLQIIRYSVISETEGILNFFKKWEGTRRVPLYTLHYTPGRKSRSWGKIVHYGDENVWDYNLDLFYYINMSYV